MRKKSKKIPRSVKNKLIKLKKVNAILKSQSQSQSHKDVNQSSNAFINADSSPPLLKPELTSYRAFKEFTNEFFEWLKKSGSNHAPGKFLKEFDIESFKEKYPCCRYELVLKSWRKLRKKFRGNGILLSERLDQMSTDFPQLNPCDVSPAIQKFFVSSCITKTQSTNVEEEHQKLPKEEIMEQIRKEERSMALEMMKDFKIFYA